jgi:hypothetical protein
VKDVDSWAQRQAERPLHHQAQDAQSDVKHAEDERACAQAPRIAAGQRDGQQGNAPDDVQDIVAPVAGVEADGQRQPVGDEEQAAFEQ